MDECHKVKTCTAKITQVAFALNGNRRLGLTETPISNTEVELDSIICTLSCQKDVDFKPKLDMFVRRRLQNDEWEGKRLIEGLPSKNHFRFFQILNSYI